MKSNLLLSLLAIALSPLLVSADTVATTTDATSTATSTITVTTITTASFNLCQINALQKRDTKLANIRNTYNISSGGALEERKAALTQALLFAGTTAQISGKKAAIAAYKKTIEEARENYLASRKAVWNTYEDDIKMCRDVQKTQENKERLQKKEIVEQKKVEVKQKVQQEMEDKKKVLEKRAEELKAVREEGKTKIQEIRGTIQASTTVKVQSGLLNN